MLIFGHAGITLGAAVLILVWFTVVLVCQGEFFIFVRKGRVIQFLKIRWNEPRGGLDLSLPYNLSYCFSFCVR